MAIPTSRTKEKGQIRIHQDLCSACGLCVSVCKDFSIEIFDGKLRQAENPLFGCIGCGHCMAICPNNAIEIQGREISSNDLFELNVEEQGLNYEQLLAFLQKRRSIREFKDIDVEEKEIQKIIDASTTAPMGLPPSDVNVLIFNGKEKVNSFAASYSNYLKSMRWFVSPFFLSLMRIFWGKETDELFRKFLKPLFNVYIDEMKKGNNFITYDAPLAMYFYGSPYSDPADPIIAATYAMHAGESLGLGTCMLGGIHPMIQNGAKAKKFRQQHGIKYKSREGLFVIFGYPDVKYSKRIQRTFASVKYV